MKRLKIKTLYNRGILIAFALIYALLVTLGSTFSWVTSSNEKANEFMGGMGLRTVIIEDFEQQRQWQPGTDITKIVSVCNDGISPGFARVSFEEIVTRMKAGSVPEPYGDWAESGVEPEFCSIAEWSAWEDAAAVFADVEFREGGLPAALPAAPNQVVVKVSASPAGLQRYKYAIYQQLEGGQAYRRMTAQFSASGGTLIVRNPRYWGFGDAFDAEEEAAWGLANRTGATPAAPAAAKYDKLICDAKGKITIKYTNVVTALGSVGDNNEKWFYNEDDGFFYYIGRLEPGGVSPTLVTGLSLAADADVSYSSMGLQFIVNLEALQLRPEALADWGLTSGPLYEHLSSFC